MKFFAPLVLALTLATPSAFAFYVSTPKVNVVDETEQQAPSQWLYSYIVENQTSCFGNCGDTVQGRPINEVVLGVRTFSIPFFSDSGIIDIAAPSGWAFQILAVDTFGMGFGAKTLEWYATADNAFIARNASLGGFTYKTLFAPGKGPFHSYLGNNDKFEGDPAIPLSPDAIKAGIGQPAAVPEPQSVLLVMAALGALLVRRRVKGQQ